ncbi:MAG: DUF4838 domain-containing protein, partial [Bacteroidetes bacterium]
GVLFGVYDFIEKVLGVRWYFPPGDLGTVIPHKKDIIITKTNYSDAPAFQLRTGGLYSYGYTYWQWHPITRAGATTDLFVNHTMATWGPVFGKTHPEYFSIRSDGTRNINYKGYYHPDSHICYSNPGVLKQHIENVKIWNKDHSNGILFGCRPPSDKYVYLAAADVMEVHGICHCKNCLKKWHPENPPWPSGQFSDLIFGYAKKLAAALKKNHLPQQRVAVLAYAGYERAPDDMKWPDNVDVCLAEIKSPAIQVDPRVYTSERKNILKWSKLVKGKRERLTMWHYFCYPNDFCSAPMPAPHVMAKWFKDYVNVISGLFANRGAKKTFLMAWLWHKLLWNPYADVDKLLDEFYRNMYGPAYKPMKALFQLEINRWENTRWSEVPLKGYVPERLVYEESYPPEIVAKLKQYIEKAKELTPPESIYRKRVQWQIERHKPFFEESKLWTYWKHRWVHVVFERVKNQDNLWWKNKKAYELKEQMYGKEPKFKTKVFFGHTGKD